MLIACEQLTPQHTFPATLLDVFHAYLTLLAPPPKSPHDATPPSSIVLAADSLESTLVPGLLQLILQLARQKRVISFHAKTVDASAIMPAGAHCWASSPTSSTPFPPTSKTWPPISFPILSTICLILPASFSPAPSGRLHP